MGKLLTGTMTGNAEFAIDYPGDMHFYDPSRDVDRAHKDWWAAKMRKFAGDTKCQYCGSQVDCSLVNCSQCGAPLRRE